MQSEETTKLARNLLIIIGSAILVVLIVIFGIIPLIKSLNRPAYLDILLAPSDAVVSIDGAEYTSATYEFEPGSYIAVVKRQGFKDKTFELELARGETAKLYTYLIPEDNDWSFYEEEMNKTSLENLIRIVEHSETEEKNTEVENLIKKVNIESAMPIDFAVCREPASRMTCDSVEVTYDYEKECDNMLCVVITGRNSELTNEVLNEVKTRLLEKGFNLDNYKYIYKQNTLR